MSQQQQPAYYSFTQPLTGPQRESEPYGGPDTDPDDHDHDTQGPPKKKRRRQALSCTECKRRKIKCDRNQPCAPCTRRGDQEKCQWHAVEPVEKYATKAEYDELKASFDALEARFEQLEALVLRSSGVPYYQMGIQMSGSQSVGNEAVSQPPSSSNSYPSGAGSSSAPLLYQSMMAPSFHHQSNFETSTQAHSRGYGPAPEAQSPRHQPQNIPRSMLSTSSMAPQSPSVSRRPPDTSGVTKSPHMSTALPPPAAGTALPVSLASITSPYSSPDLSKNYHAQTLNLGERLRLSLTEWFLVIVRPFTEHECPVVQVWVYPVRHRNPEQDPSCVRKRNNKVPVFQQHRLPRTKDHLEGVVTPASRIAIWIRV